MLYIESKFKTLGRPASLVTDKPRIVIARREWHIGEKAPVPWDFMHDVVLVQADGDELEFVQKVLGVRPDAHVSVIRFFGDDAKFIAANVGPTPSSAIGLGNKF